MNEPFYFKPEPGKILQRICIDNFRKIGPWSDPKVGKWVRIELGYKVNQRWFANAPSDLA